MTQKDDDKSSFTNIDPNTLPPELQSIYKSMQADYTRKTQEISEQRKEFDSLREQLDKSRKEIEDLAAQNEQIRAYNAEWQEWFENNYKDLEGDEMDGQTGIDPLVFKDKRVEPRPQDEKKFRELASIVTKQNQEIEKLNKGFQTFLQLYELSKKDPTLDAKAVIDRAVELGTEDIGLAYNDVYRDKMINERAEQIAQEKIKTELEKEKAKILTNTGMSGPPDKYYRRPENVPKSLEDATQEILRELRENAGG